MAEGLVMAQNLAMAAHKFHPVIPAKAGIHLLTVGFAGVAGDGSPIKSGMTIDGEVGSYARR